jgi:SAM-dependent methyltransferase
MTAESVSEYEKNLRTRLEELRQGDRAYNLHGLVIDEAIIFSIDHCGASDNPRILDVGCGLGFMTNRINRYWNAVGVDISGKAIELARTEHPDTAFYTSSVESFPKIMKDKGIEPFSHALLNMVLHSVDDETANNILVGVGKCLKPQGAAIAIVPTEKWLMQKLIEYAQDQEMQKAEGIEWVRKQLLEKQVTIPVKIAGGDYYPEPITVYNRTLDDYAHLFKESGFGLYVHTYDDKMEPIDTEEIPFWTISDYTAHFENIHRLRWSLLTFKK